MNDKSIINWIYNAIERISNLEYFNIECEEKSKACNLSLKVTFHSESNIFLYNLKFKSIRDSLKLFWVP